MSAITFDEMAHQRVLEFVNSQSGENRLDNEPVEENFTLHTPEAPASIAQQTAADLLRFLQARQ